MKNMKNTSTAKAIFITAIMLLAKQAFPAPAASSGQGIYWGAWLDGISPNNQSLSQFDQMAEKKMSIVGAVTWWYPYETWGNFNTLFTDKTNPARNWANIVSDRGSIPMIHWSAFDPLHAPACNAPGYIDYIRKFSPARIAAGDFDAYILRWAQQIKAWGRPLHLRFMHELNISRNYANPCEYFTSWEAEVTLAGQVINRRADSIAAWRRIVNIFRQAGATNVKFVWSVLSYPSAAYGGGNQVSLASIYPGDAYVDWIGVECYNFDPNDWLSCADRMKGIYHEAAALGSGTVPILNVEMGAVEDPRKAGWIFDALSPNSPNAIYKLFPRLTGIMYWEDNRSIYYGGNSLSIQSSQGSAEQFKLAIASAVYIPASSNTLGGPALKSCTLDGQVVAHATSFTFYSSKTSASCSAISQLRSCSNGVLSGSSAYAYRACSAPAPNPRSVVVKAFLNVMGRTQKEIDADPSGVAYWATRVAGGMTEAQLAAAFQASNEYFVRQAYLTELRRRADPSGLAYYLNQLSRGTLTRSKITLLLRNACQRHLGGEC